MDWRWVALGYISYLAVVSMTHHGFARARRPVLIAAAAAWGSQALAALLERSGVSLATPLEILLPALVLLIGYWLSGLFFVRPDIRIESWLRSVDHAVLTRSGVLDWYRRAPRAIANYVELSYLLVYLAVPAGATALALAGHGDRIGRFWTVVLLAEFVCYGMLPWIQTRPPRSIETDTEAPTVVPPLRRLNLTLVNRASIQVNTLPSGHAAGAVATALAVASTMPLTGAIFLIVAFSIAIATVLGRYHYVVDTVLGVLVAAGAWALLIA
jgi:membrane-associated phospholipid phosphatase